MKTGMRYIVPLIGAGAVSLSVFSGALASHPDASSGFTRDAVKAYTVNGRLTVTDVLRVQKNQSVYGRQYAHGGLQVWKGLSVTSGGVTADALNVKGALGAASGTFSGNLQAGTLQSGAMNGSTLALSGAATVGGPVTSAGKLTGNGIDAGTGGLTTTGSVATGGLTATSIADSGALAAGSITSSGPVAGQTGAFGSLQVTGNVNFTGANVTGLNFSGGTLPTLNVGSTTSSTSPLLLSANGHSTALGVNGNGAVTADNMAINSGLSVGGAATVGGNLAVGGSGGVTSNILSAQNAAGTSSPGTLSLIGSTIALNGNVQSSGSMSILGGRDLVFSTGNGTATHVTTNTDLDVAGQITINADGSNTDRATTRNFIEPYSSIPYVVVTPTSDPNPAGAAPHVWVVVNASSGKYTGFTLHYIVPTGPASSGSITYNYHVVAG